MLLLNSIESTIEMKRKIGLFLFFLVFGKMALAQSFTAQQVTQGYGVFGDKVTFIFDEELYNVQPERVVVTGEFRNWDSNMDHPDWLLSKTGSQWTLTIDNSDYRVIRTNSTFKFRINDGTWLDPPEVAPNKKGGDLVFMQGVIPPGLKAEIRSDGLIWATITGERPLLPEAYRLTDAKGNEIGISGILPYDGRQLLVKPARAIDKTRVYFLEIPSLHLRSHCSYTGWFRDLYSTRELGANIDEGITTVRLFAPRATDVKLYLYEGKDDDKPFAEHNLVRQSDGVWEVVFEEDLHGTYYDFTIHGPDDPGNYFYETNPVHINDPYARVSDDTWGKARIWQRTQPASPLAGGIPPMQDVIAYEVHVQDFTDQLPIPDNLKGTFLGMITPGLRNARGEKIGFDYLVDLGINVVHLMPVQEYIHFPTDDWVASFKDDSYMIEQGVSEENYQWGYRTTFAMAVEARYRSKDKEPGEERNEFRDLVQAFHDKGIAVIIDIVPNHTGENMDGGQWFFNFAGIDKQYYYRTKDFENIGAYGNEVKTEERPMTQRWVIDQCLYFINEFGIDGFRIDLAGQIDQQTLIALKKAIGEDKILYGEPWIGSNDPDFENNPDWDWYKEDAPITFFQDDARNAFKGPVFELKDKYRDRGWPGGNFAERDRVMLGLANKFKEDKTPLSGINYLDIHDNFALADQFGQENFDGRLDVDEDAYKIAATLLYTSLGPIVTHGGTEMMRSKALAPLREVVKETQAGYMVYMHGYRDTYNHRKANQFIWEQAGQLPQGSNRNNYKNMYEFWRGLNQFRLSEEGRVFRQYEAVPEGYYTWILPDKESQLGYIVDEKVMVLLNAGTEEAEFNDVNLPPGNWRLIGTNEAINYSKGVKGPQEYRKMKGDRSYSVKLNPVSLMIWLKD